jgi:hypothetical protein
MCIARLRACMHASTYASQGEYVSRRAAVSEPLRYDTAALPAASRPSEIQVQHAERSSRLRTYREITAMHAVADLEKFRSGGKSADWGHSLYKFAKSKEIFFKYIKIL